MSFRLLHDAIPELHNFTPELQMPVSALPQCFVHSPYVSSVNIHNGFLSQ